ncbi:dihydroorotate dehydrogenase electron transfer subunit [Tannockella kyphosi]|uniref:dihydroorotate dehydrogenase electron transfer subunit n=1 Tax=Tannockella kyphosi TaxID=2899121 RepID=UPI0020133085|nr:dihydroorotate dehydrogenase electron transfer subunit [Tannockella kyphosi]
MKNYQDELVIKSITNIAKDVYEMVLVGPGVKYISAPGQFINMKINNSLQPYLRRPMSISDYDDNSLTTVFKVVGQGTEILKNKEIGSTIDCLIGLGNGFSIQDLASVVLIGGGLGTPPLYKLGKELASMGVKVTTVLGFASKEDVFYVDKFKEFSKVYIATNDGTMGQKGNVLDVIKHENITFDYYYTCGPERMLDALVEAYPDFGELSFEARMGCGFGACMGCSCKTKTSPYKRICVEGPVLLAKEVIVNG